MCGGTCGKIGTFRKSHPNVWVFFLLCIFLALITIGAGWFEWLEEDAQVEAHDSKVKLYKRLEKQLKPAAFDAFVDEFGHPEEETGWDSTGSRFGRLWALAYTIVTTIGYGKICPITVEGKVFVSFYSLLTIPLVALVLLAFSERILTFLAWSCLPKSALITSTFEKYDHSGNGQLQRAELHAALDDMLEGGVTKAKFEEYMKEFDADGNGQLDVKEFTKLCQKLHVELDADNLYKLVLSVIFLFLHIMCGVLVFWETEDWELVDSFYFTIITLTTIGLGDFVPSSQIGQAFLVIWSIFGLSILATIFSLAETAMQDALESEKDPPTEKTAADKKA